MHPFSQITVPDFVRRRIREVLVWPDAQVKASALREPRDAFPHQPPARPPLPRRARPARRSHLARRAAPPRPASRPRHDAERAARAHELTAGLAEDCHLTARLLGTKSRAERDGPSNIPPRSKGNEEGRIRNDLRRDLARKGYRPRHRACSGQRGLLRVESAPFGMITVRKSS